MNIESTYMISASASRVFEAIVDPDMVMKWLGGLIEFRITKSQDNVIGSQFLQVWDEGNDTYELAGTITLYEEDKRYAIELTGKDISVKVDYSLEEDGDATRITQRTHVEYTGFIRILSIITRRFAEKSYKKTLDENYQKLTELLVE